MDFLIHPREEKRKQIITNVEVETAIQSTLMKNNPRPRQSQSTILPDPQRRFKTNTSVIIQKDIPTDRKNRKEHASTFLQENIILTPKPGKDTTATAKPYRPIFLVTTDVKLLHKH